MEINQLKQKFIELYGGSEQDIRVFSAAGRVNLIGEHIDYCGGKVGPLHFIIVFLKCPSIVRISPDFQ